MDDLLCVWTKRLNLCYCAKTKDGTKHNMAVFV